MAKDGLKSGAAPLPIAMLCAVLARLGGGVYPLQMLLLQRIYGFSYGALGVVLFSGLCGGVLAWLLGADAPSGAHRSPLFGVLLFLLGNISIAFSSTAAGVAAGGSMLGAGGFLMEKAVLLGVPQAHGVRFVKAISAYRLVATLATVFTPLLGALILLRRGVRGSALLLGFLAVVLLLFLSLLPLEFSRPYAASGRTSLEECSFSGLFRPLPVLAFLMPAAVNFMAIAVAFTVFLASDNLLLSGVVMSLLRLTAWLLKMAVFL